MEDLLNIDTDTLVRVTEDTSIATWNDEKDTVHGKAEEELQAQCP